MNEFDKLIKFTAFVESFRCKENESTINTILEGYEVSYGALNEGIGDSIKKLGMIIGTLTALASAGGNKEQKLDSLMNLAYGTIENIAKNDQEGSNSIEIPDLVAKVTSAVNKIDPQKGEKFTKELSKFVQSDKITNIQGTRATGGYPSIISEIYPTKEEAIAELNAKGITDVDFDSVKQTQGGVFSSPKIGYYAFPKGSNRKHAAKIATQKLTKSIGQVGME